MGTGWAGGGVIPTQHAARGELRSTREHSDRALPCRGRVGAGVAGASGDHPCGARSVLPGGPPCHLLENTRLRANKARFNLLLLKVS